MSVAFPAYPALSLSQLQTASQGCGYVVTSGLVSISSASTETPLMYIKNASVSGSFSGSSINLFASSFGVDSSSALGIFKLYFNPNVSANGTGLGINNLRNNSSAPSSVMNAYVSPTVNSNGTLVAVDFSTFSQFIGINAPLIIDPGNSVLITATVSTSSTSVVGQLAWFETRF